MKSCLLSATTCTGLQSGMNRAGIGQIGVGNIMGAVQ